MNTQSVSIALYILLLYAALTGEPSVNESGMIGDIRTVISAEAAHSRP